MNKPLMNLEYVKPVLRYVDGVPGYKAGEWPGIIPNHFQRMKCIIQEKRENKFIMPVMTDGI